MSRTDIYNLYLNQYLHYTYANMLSQKIKQKGNFVYNGIACIVYMDDIFRIMIYENEYCGYQNIKY